MCTRQVSLSTHSEQLPHDAFQAHVPVTCSISAETTANDASSLSLLWQVFLKPDSTQLSHEAPQVRRSKRKLKSEQTTELPTAFSQPVEPESFHAHFVSDGLSYGKQAGTSSAERTACAISSKCAMQEESFHVHFAHSLSLLWQVFFLVSTCHTTLFMCTRCHLHAPSERKGLQGQLQSDAG